MKKFFVIAILSFFNFLPCLAGEMQEFNLSLNRNYILILDEAAANIHISNPSVLRLSPIATLENDKEQLFIQTLNSGVSDVSIKTDLNEYSYKFSVANDLSRLRESDNLFEIDIPFEAGDAK